jgi:hypothetical protein
MKKKTNSLSFKKAGHNYEEGVYFEAFMFILTSNITEVICSMRLRASNGIFQKAKMISVTGTSHKFQNNITV